MGDRTPAAGPARLTEADLERIETRAAYGGWNRRADVLALVAALRAVWQERDGMRGKLMAAAVEVDNLRGGIAIAAETVEMIRDERDRYRAALEHYADPDIWTAPPGHTWDELDKGYYLGEGPGFGVAAAALAAPGADGGNDGAP